MTNMAKKESYLDKFKRLALLEYVSLGNVLGEEGEDLGAPAGPQGGPDGEGPMPPQGGPDMGGADMGGGMPQGGGAMPPQGLNPQGAPADGADMGGGMPQDDGAMPPQGGPDMGGMPQGGEMPDMGSGALEDDVEEIDVDDLVDSQEETEKKVAKLMKKFSGAADKMMTAIDTLSSKIDASSDRLSKLEAEFEKRNPTPVEKISMRTTDSYPFGQTVDNYWKNKEATSNYRVDNVENKEPEYTITKDDVDNISDYQNIAREMNSRRYSLSDLLNL